MLFNQIIGQDETKQTLVRAVQNNHVAHAQLFDGRAGGAALALAWAFATYLNCEDKQTDDACGQCASCYKMKKLVHPDLHFVFPLPRSPKENEDLMAELTPLWREFLVESPYRTLQEWLEHIKATANQQGIIPIKEARSIINKLSLKSFEGGYKIMLVWQPELLNIAAANALLKILEEPPEKTLFLLVTNSSDKLLTTILSRTQRINVRAATDDEVVNFLENKGVEAKKARQAAFLSEGNLSLAAQIATDTEGHHHDWFANWVRTAYKCDWPSLVKMADEFDEWPKKKQKELLDYALRLFRDLFLWKNGAEALLRLQDEELKFVQNFSKVVSEKALETIVSELSTAYYHIERNARGKILFLDLSLLTAQWLRKG